CDALLGAAALGDIGHLFPDTDASYKGADSLLLLSEVMRQVRAKGFELGNADITVIAQAPKLAPHINTMRQNIAAAMQVDVDQIGIKATTTEKLGFTGRREGIATQAVALLTYN
ncbi:MAG: 2-C-methyl-D-erythritol 2,4-cyclodiphosphate synthase, partial [Zetaproteobacteria bacterium CG_4_8_14_3_um_filter_59_5]